MAGSCRVRKGKPIGSAIWLLCHECQRHEAVELLLVAELVAAELLNGGQVSFSISLLSRLFDDTTFNIQLQTIAWPPFKNPTTFFLASTLSQCC